MTLSRLLECICTGADGDCLPKWSRPIFHQYVKNPRRQSYLLLNTLLIACAIQGNPTMKFFYSHVSVLELCFKLSLNTGDYVISLMGHKNGKDLWPNQSTLWFFLVKIFFFSGFLTRSLVLIKREITNVLNMSFFMTDHGVGYLPFFGKIFRYELYRGLLGWSNTSMNNKLHQTTNVQELL